MRVLLMLSGAVLSIASLLFWIWLNGMAGAHNLARSTPRIAWLTEEALYLFWLPFAAGVALAVVGWRRR